MISSAAENRSRDEGPITLLELASALQRKLDWIRGSTGVKTELTQFGAGGASVSSTYRDMLLIAREALANVVRHSRATSVRVGLVEAVPHMTLLVEDDGVGISPDASLFEYQGGLTRMRERALSGEGSFKIESIPGWGTRVRVTFRRPPRDSRFSRRIDVVVIERRPALRAGLGAIASRSDACISIVAEIEEPDRAIDVIGALAPAVAIVGLGFDELAPPLITALREKVPGLGIIVVSTPWTTKDLLERAFAAGATICIDAANDGPTIASAVEAAISGRRVRDGLRRARPDLAIAEDGRLTMRELEVRRLVELGRSDKEIGESLYITVKTVEKHVSSVLRKSGVRNRRELLLRNKLDGQVLLHDTGGRTTVLRPPTV